MNRLVHAVAGSAFVAVLAAGSLVAVSSPGAGRAASAVEPAISPCTSVVTKTARPAVVLLGETVDVTLIARTTCPPAPLDVAFVLDESQFNGEYSGTMRTASQAVRMVQSLEMAKHPEVRIGVVGYNTTARTLCPLTDDESRIRRGLGSIRTTGDQLMERGIVEAQRMLEQGRMDVDRDLLQQVMVVMSDGKSLNGCDPAVRAARRASADGILVISVNYGLADGRECMRRIAGPGAGFFELEGAGLNTALVPSRDRFHRLIQALTITDTLSPDVAYVAGSAAPQPAVGLDGQGFRWALDGRAADAVTLTLRVRPRTSGWIATNLAATGVLTDVVGRRSTWTFPVPRVHVLGAPSPAATATTSAPEPPPDTPTTSAPEPPPDTPTAAGPVRGEKCFLPDLRRQRE